MKLGFGLYRHMLTPANFRFARQCGATHLIIHLVDYFASKKTDQGSSNQPVGASEGWGPAGDENQLWSLEELISIRRQVEEQGLILEGIENFDPAHWYDVLLDGPNRDRHLENCKTIIRNLGAAGIPIFGYNFSIAGVAGRIKRPFARGDAESVGMDGISEVIETPIPNGMVWNMVYNREAFSTGVLPEIDHQELWRRLTGFLNEILPVAEEAGVVMAAHPDDPPLPFIRKQPRLVYQPYMYDDLIAINPSPANKLEFCLGSLSEMTEGDIYEVTDHFTRDNRVAYIHFRNVEGKVPHYRETFIDDGDIDMKKIVQILKKNKYEGVLIPDHTPLMNCDAPWHAGMAFAMGYMKALL